MPGCSRELEEVRRDSRDFADHLARLHLLCLCADGWSAFLITNALVENLPDQATEPVRDGADGLRVAKTRDESSIDDREDRAFGFSRRVCCLIEESSHLTIALRTAMAVVHARAFFIAGTGAHPGGQVFGRWKRRRCRSDFGDDLLRGIRA